MTSWASTSIGAVSAGEYATTILPKYPAATGTRAGVMWCHGNTGLSYGVLAAEYAAIMAALSDAGHPILSGDWGGGTNWGNDTSLTRLTTGRAYLQSTLGAAAGRVVLIGASMGAVTAMAWAAANPTLVHAIVGLIPVCDVTDVMTNNRGGLAADVNGAYGGAWSEATHGATHNPATIATAGGLDAVPMRHYYGTTDAIVIPSTVTTLAAAASATAVPVTGGHAAETIAAVSATDVLAFIQTAIG